MIDVIIGDFICDCVFSSLPRVRYWRLTKIRGVSRFEVTRLLLSKSCPDLEGSRSFIYDFQLLLVLP